MYRGPLPSPRILAEFESLVPGAADRVISRWEKQSDHRIEIEKMIVSGNVEAQRRGLVVGAFLVVFVSVMSVVFYLNGATAASVATIITALAGLAGVFVFGQPRQDRERREAHPLRRPRPRHEATETLPNGPPLHT